MSEVRAGVAADLARVAEIQAAAPEAAHWPVEDYLSHDFLVGLEEGRVAGFLAGRTVAPGEHELLNLAVAAEARRHGVARSLLADWLSRVKGDIYIEVRESNSGAQTFYQTIGFEQVGRRSGYYDSPPEAAVVLKFHSC